VIGSIGLHGGGEFGPDDGQFLGALLRAAGTSRAIRDRACAGVGPGGPSRTESLRVAILPTAAAGSRPDLAVEHGRIAFEGAAASIGSAIRVEGIDVLTRADAERGGPAGRLVGADVVYIVGGDPGHLLDVLEGSLAWRSVLAAHARGAAVAGASAGAMVLGELTWTPGGPRPGLDLVPRVAVVPHYDPERHRAWAGGTALPGARPPVGWLGLDEATGVIREARGAGSDPGTGAIWQVRGPGSVRWFPVAGGSVGPLGDGSTLRLT
jgi:cyanophycinase-like exopeptidase